MQARKNLDLYYKESEVVFAWDGNTDGHYEDNTGIGLKFYQFTPIPENLTSLAGSIVDKNGNKLTLTESSYGPDYMGTSYIKGTDQNNVTQIVIVKLRYSSSVNVPISNLTQNESHTFTAGLWVNEDVRQFIQDTYNLIPLSYIPTLTSDKIPVLDNSKIPVLTADKLVNVPKQLKALTWSDSCLDPTNAIWDGTSKTPNDMQTAGFVFDDIFYSSSTYLGVVVNGFMSLKYKVNIDPMGISGGNAYLEFLAPYNDGSDNYLVKYAIKYSISSMGTGQSYECMTKKIALI